MRMTSSDIGSAIISKLELAKSSCEEAARHNWTETVEWWGCSPLEQLEWSLDQIDLLVEDLRISVIEEGGNT